MKRWIACLLTILIALFLTAFTVRSASASRIEEIRIADGKGDWGYPNPYRHYPRGPGYIRMSWVFDTLVWKDQNGYVPALADSWSYDKGKKGFTFKLNPKAKWHDGKPVTADDVVFTIGYFKKHPYAWTTLDYVDRAEAADEHTVVVFLTGPYAPFLSDVAGTMPVIPKHIWENIDNPQTSEDPKTFIGSGPYVFRDFNKAQGTYLYEAFPDYHLGRPKADRLIYVRSGKPMVSLLTGQVDLANIEPDMADQLGKKGMTVIEDERSWLKKVMINHRKAPFSDKRFRQALAYGIDRREIIDKAHHGFGTPASFGLLSPDHEMYNPDTPVYAHDPEKARKLIESLGYRADAQGRFSKEGQPLKIELLASNISVAGSNVADRDGEIVKRQLEKIGIAVELVNLEQATADSRVRNWDFDLAILGHGGITGDPKILNEMISSKWGAASVNSARYDADPELNRLLEEQITEMDPARRKETVFAIQQRYAGDLPAISLYYLNSMAAYNPAKTIVWYYTKGGICRGIPIPQNKMSLIK